MEDIIRSALSATIVVLLAIQFFVLPVMVISTTEFTKIVIGTFVLFGLTLLAFTLRFFRRRK